MVARNVLNPAVATKVCGNEFFARAALHYKLSLNRSGANGHARARAHSTQAYRHPGS
jgi:hypothetical protein